MIIVLTVLTSQNMLTSQNNTSVANTPSLQSLGISVCGASPLACNTTLPMKLTPHQTPSAYPTLALKRTRPIPKYLHTLTLKPVPCHLTLAPDESLPGVYPCPPAAQ